MKWQEILHEIRAGKTPVITDNDGIPLVAVHAGVYELRELMEALATGYNALGQRVLDEQKKVERIRQLARAQFPADRKEPDPGWIAVEDMLPPRSGSYMTYNVKRPTMGVYPYEFSAKHGEFNATDSQEAPIHAIKVTHWHPNPNPPTVEVDAEG